MIARRHILELTAGVVGAALVAACGGTRPAAPAPTVPTVAPTVVERPRARRIERLRQTALREGARAASFRVAEGEGGGTAAIVTYDRASSDEVRGCEERWGWVVTDEGEAALDTEDLVLTWPEGGMACRARALRLAEDPHAGLARLAEGDDVARVVRASAAGVTTVPARCAAEVADTVCGRVAACRPDGALVAVETGDGRVVAEDRCLDALRAAVAALGQATERARDEALRGLPSAPVTERNEDGAASPLPLAGPRCARLTPARRAAATARIRAGVRARVAQVAARDNPQDNPEAGGTVAETLAEFDRGGVRAELGCVDRGGAVLARVEADVMVSGPGNYRALWRVTPDGATELTESDPRQVDLEAVVDLTGDGVPELVQHERFWESQGSSMTAFSAAWPRPAVIYTDPGEEGRVTAPWVRVVATREGGALVVGDALRVWDGQAFVPATRGFDAVRQSLDRWRAARARVAAARAAVLSAPPEGSGARPPCDAPARGQWSARVAAALRAAGVPAPDAERLAAAPVACAP